MEGSGFFPVPGPCRVLCSTAIKPKPLFPFCAADSKSVNNHFINYRRINKSACGEIFDITNNTFYLRDLFWHHRDNILSVFLTTVVYGCDTFKVLDNADRLSHIHTHRQVALYFTTDSIAPPIVPLRFK